jgi:hypothetical protein
MSDACKLHTWSGPIALVQLCGSVINQLRMMNEAYGIDGYFDENEGCLITQFERGSLRVISDNYFLTF